MKYRKTSKKVSIYYQVPFFEIQADIFMSFGSIWRAFNPVKSQESNTEKQVKISASIIQKKEPYNIFIINSQNLKMREVKI